MRPRPGRRGCILLATLLATLLAACAPTLNWRDVRPDDSHAQLQFPCKPVGQQRRLPLAGVAVKLTLHACSAGDRTWGLAFADMGDPSKVGPALQELMGSAVSNLVASRGDAPPLKVPGATPYPESLRSSLRGRLPDGAAVTMEIAVFAQGTRVYQASVLGAAAADDGAETFLSSVRLGP